MTHTSRTFALVLSATIATASPLAAQVPFSRLAAAERDSANWLTYSGSYSGQRFSRLSQVNRTNVAALRPVWLHQLQNTQFMAEATPLVADGVMYVSETMSAVTALDVRTGRTLWRYAPTIPPTTKWIGFLPTNRGVALLDSTVYLATINAHLIALDARSGTVRWDVEVADNKLGYAFTLAPLAIKGKVLVGVSGGEAGIRGFIDAYDATTGKLAWRFHTIPGSGEPGNESWGGDSWKTGGGPTWLTGTFDPELNTVYWGVGNPGPDWNGDSRPGDNLYTCSLVALDADTGKLKWHFQFTPHDTHDWDANQIPVLVDATVNGARRKLVLTANRNAFYYALDRVTGEFLGGRDYAKQTWSTGLDAKGKAQVIPGKEPSDSGTLVWPSLQGATNWNSPAYSPRTNLFYVNAREMGSYYYKREAEYEPGNPFMGGGERALENDSASGAVRALEPLTGKMRWEFRHHSPPWAGLMATAGGLVFSGSNEGNFFALDASTGKALWQFQTGGFIRAAPITYMVDGKQRVAIVSNNAVIVFGLP
ncbi:MAG: PQQ-dependent dehydrogenase, methanol/ethanol family [Gemmatimonadetes bacterium]|nr:PQQ-dependent dehydrogenase, methanol/ethanol family [Gemmatimonadota bacterium]